MTEAVGMKLLGEPNVSVWLVILVLLGVITKAGTGFVMLRPPDFVVFEGDVAIFTCSPLYSVAIPILERNGAIAIQKDNPRITFNDYNINTMEGNRTYQLANVTRADNGTTFRCSMGGYFSDTITMKVVVAPRVTGPSGQYTILEHDSTPRTFHYTSYGFPTPHSLLWLYNGHPFIGNTRVAISGKSNLTLTVGSSLRIDSGNYTLVVTSAVGQVSQSLVLRIIYNDFLESPANATAATGGVVTMSCVHRFGWAYAWFSNKEPLYADNDKVSLNASGRTLHYGPVDYADHLLQVYCVVHASPTGPLFVSPHSVLTVPSPPTVHASPLVVGREGSDVLLTFTVNSYPPPTSVVYHRNEQHITLNRRIVALGADRTSLFIGNVSLLDEGNYTIVVRNELGEASGSTALDIQYRPVIAPLLESVVTQIHKSIILSCGQSFHGNPSPKFTWFHMTFDLSDDSRFTTDQQNGQLTLSATNLFDGGEYVCTASNEVGSSSTRVTLLILDPPGPPTNIIILNISSSWIHLTWSPPNDQGSLPVSAYKITAMPHPTDYTTDFSTTTVSSNQNPFTVDQGTTVLPMEYSPNSACVEVDCETTEVFVEGELVEANVTRLIPAVEYVLRVSALSNGTNLEGEPSSDVSVKTGISVPSIGSVSATVYGPGSCSVQWTLAYSGGLPLQSFHIHFRRSNDSHWRNVSDSLTNSLTGEYSLNDQALTVISPGQRSWIVHGLESSEEYHFRVLGTNVFGQGKYTTTLHPIVSHMLGVPSRPVQPYIASWTDNSAIITSSVIKIGFERTLRVLVVLLLNGRKVSSYIDTIYNYTQNVEFNVAYNNISYRGDWQFQIIASNEIGVSEPSIPSLPARDYVYEIPVVFATAGPIVGSIVGGINGVVMVIMVILCTVMIKELCRRKKSMARRVEMAQANDCPLSPRSIFFGDLRDSPDGRSNPHIDTPSDPFPPERRSVPLVPIYATIPTITPPTPQSSVSMV